MADLIEWLNFLAPDGPCFDPSVLPVPGSPVSLAMIDAIVEVYVARAPATPIRVLEIGSFVGTSAIAWGKAFERHGISDYLITCCDMWHHFNDTEYSATETRIGNQRNSFNHTIFRHNVQKAIGWEHVVELIGASAVILPELRDGWFDLVYVDGFHGYSATTRDVCSALRVCKPGGIVCGDDYDAESVDVATLSEAELEQDHQWLEGRYIHGGVVLAVNELLGAPKPFWSFWAFDRDPVTPIDCAALPRRVPPFLPADWQARTASMFETALAALPPGAAESRPVD